MPDYSYDSSGICSIANLTFLEDPGPGQAAKEVMINVNTANNIPMYCRGGANCCSKDTICNVGDGDCNKDGDCPGVLICGNNNCLTGENIARNSLINKGLWDPEDDCCERACTPAHPCPEGGGFCLADADCKNSGWAKCGASCTNVTYFPRNKFINNTETFGYKTTDKCCYRFCNKRYNVCGINQVGCWNDEDCGPGLYCKRNVAQPYCTDINECEPTNDKFFGSKYCNKNAFCTNTIGNFTCVCFPGYANFTPWEGCVDIDECTQGGNNCSSSATCWNTPGSFACTCQTGLTGNPLTGCIDIDECTSSTLNNCKTGSIPVYNTDTFGGESMKFLHIGKGGDTYSLTVRFAVSGPSSASFSLCDGASWNSCYEVLIGGGVTANTMLSIIKCKRATPRQCVLVASVQHGAYSEMALNTTYFKTFWVKTQLMMNGTLSVSVGLAAGITAALVFLDKDTTPISVSHVGLRNLGYQETVYWRNIRVDMTSQTCTNTFGGYFCTDNDLELVGIGYGGETTDVNTMIPQLTVVSKNYDSCGLHLIPNLPGRIGAGSVVIENMLYICGGSLTDLGVPTSDCRSINLNSYSPFWIASPRLPEAIRDFVMLSYQDSFYIIGGANGALYSNAVYAYRTTSSSWSLKADLPVPLYGHCGVSDPLYSRLWILGGQNSYKTGTVYLYKFSTDSWIVHSYLPWPTSYFACGIILKRTGVRWLLTVGGSINAGAVAYLDLTSSNVTWINAYSLYNSYQQYRMTMITPTPYSAFLLGGNTQRYGRDLRNFWAFNQETNIFEASTFYLQNEMYGSTWAMAQKSYKALQNCFTYITYAAVGWGSEAFRPEWDVLLRSRTKAGDPKRPARCDTAIPDLSPGRQMPGIASIDYRLMVCGGWVSGQDTDNLCFWLDTNTTTPLWSTMTPMLVPRSRFQLITFGDAMYAIGGHAVQKTNRVDRWSLTQGWVNMANYPNVNIYAHCAVADEGYDSIYVLGGIYCTSQCYETNAAYKYKVSTDSWTNFYTLPWSRQYHGCGIIRRKADGNRLLMVVSHDWNRETLTFDLTANFGWKYYISLDQNWARPSWISLTPFESFLAGGYTEYWYGSTW